jgi:hypothetical protein
MADNNRSGTSSDMMSDEDSTTNSRRRRTVLKRIAQTGALGLLPMSAGFVSGDASQRNDDGSPDTAFKPNSRSETAQFVQDCFEEETLRENERASIESAQNREVDINQRREELISELDSEQREAIGQILSEGSLIVSERSFERESADAERTEQFRSSVESAQSTDWTVTTESDTVKTKFYIPDLNRSYKAFTFTHTVTWGYNKDLLEVRNANPRASGDGKDHLLCYWQWKGASRDDVSYRAGNNYFTSMKTGIFKGWGVFRRSKSCGLAAERGFDIFDGSF